MSYGGGSAVTRLVLDEADPLQHALIRGSLTVDEAQDRGAGFRGGRRSRWSGSRLDKEAIQIPEPAARTIGRVEAVLAVIMTGDQMASQKHGLTGKALL